MHPFEFALALVAMVMLFKLVRTLILRKNPARRDDTANAELLERLNQVEERVRVLEKIVTDERYDLRQQFKDLGA
jgi:predicted RNase H-like nuclease